MCGISGELRLIEGDEAQASAVGVMNQRLAQRGPDAEGLWQSGRVCLGHRRLSVIDLSERSNQPMLCHLGDASVALVFNGAIYNYRQLRQQLIALGHRFVSDGDTEVILKGYLEWGEGLLPRLLGMFAFAIWDGRDGSLWLVRDRLGIKPLYFDLDDQRLRFASSLPALLAANRHCGDGDLSIDPVALHQAFSLHAVVPAPRTLLKGIRKLPPAHSLRIDARGEQRLQPYWELRSCRPARSMSQWEWVEAIRESLSQAVARRRLVADVPVGVLLSGGLDSSLIVGLLAEAGQSDLKTFSVGFEDTPEERGSEFEFSDPVAERFATDHQRLLVPNDQVLTRLPEAIEQMSEPMFAQDAVAFYLLSEQVSQHVKVVQSGQGADEVFAGYFWYPQMDQSDVSLSPVERFAPFYFDRDHDEFAQMVSAPWVGEDYSRAWLAERFEQIQADTHLDAVLNLDVTSLIVDDPVKRVDNMTMAFGLEARTPFLDHELVELAASMPPEWKLKDGGKYVLKAIARGLLPDAVIDRRKGYFPMPALKYVRGEFLDYMRDILNSRACRERGLFQRDYVERLLAQPDQHHTRILGNKLWHLAVTEAWLQTHVDV